jgi:hypothetical protein
MNWNMDGSICPSCGGKGRHSPRYFAAICRKCEELVTDATGQKVDVSNADIWSGVRIDMSGKILAEDTALFVNGIECQAREARFGGIVIQPVTAWQEYERQIAERRQARMQVRGG